MIASAAEGQLVDSRLAAGPVSITWTDTYGTFSNAPVGGFLASTSSYGPPPDLSLKPDIGAPGGNIRSTWPLDLGAYNILSGTSMASPHVAGAAALLLEALPGISRQEIKTRLMNSADRGPGLGTRHSACSTSCTGRAPACSIRCGTSHDAGHAGQSSARRDRVRIGRSNAHHPQRRCRRE